ncbi:exodeoxyribonuclease I [Bermanella marisrubri]|uniref:Exodeoxyribonuclease I n=1 Tax=Bermanella marisrubri TaxID=207949 RepID=Q1N149_9GAMM|nr:exodeoxyribonuclease I [Bermanella marisrubri]EAT12002.1 exodeoxyribonuclease I [Oceanobacter sp. RED65] [Bermanella marisrubri]QIZ84807.1 exodeoxyribonuclease I [Bermanella marisrubri]
MSATESIYWYDFETFGASPIWDRPAQFAGVRTDLDLNIIAEPDMFYCRQADDYLPHPIACMITGISPQTCQDKGLPEAEFIKRIHDLFMQPQTCVAGYNSIRFDDEVTRNTLYRNFFDPYQREWQNGNSRWDILDMMRCAYSLRPDGIEWPKGEDGKVSFKLENLSAANGIIHENAHDALSDVYATIGLAKLVKEKQPKLYQYLFELRRKEAVAPLLDVVNKRPVLHISGMFPVEKGCAAVMVPLAMEPKNKNAIICFDLMSDPTPLFELTAEQIQARLYTPKAELEAQGIERLPLKSIHINKCPVVLPAKMVQPEIAKKWGLSGDQIRSNLAKIKNGPDLTEKLQNVMSRDFEAHSDPDAMIYSGGFFGPTDKQAMETIRQSHPEALDDLNISFQDRRLEEMLFRYRARNYPETLTGDEFEQWETFRKQRLLGPTNGSYLNYELFAKALQEAAQTAPESQYPLLQDLQMYAESIYPY